MSPTKCYVIPVALACNADCTFCSAKTYGFGKLPPLMSISEKSVRPALERISEAGIRRFEITGGGEPTLHPELPRLVDYIRQFMPDSFIKLYTNGIKLAKLRDIDEVNISRTHWISDKANQVMRFNKSPKSLKEIVDHYRGYGAKTVRLSVPLIEGSIDGVTVAKAMLKETQGLFEQYVFRPLYENSRDQALRKVDFEFEHPLVEMDRDACCDDRLKMIWGTDHKFYRDWSFQPTDEIASAK